MQDELYIKRVYLSIIQKNERFGNLKKIFNKEEIDYIKSPPFGFLNFDSDETIISNNEIESFINEIGKSLENIYTNNKRYLIVNLFKIEKVNMRKQYENDLWIQAINTNLINELEIITKSFNDNEKKNNININNKELKINSINFLININNKSKDKIEKNEEYIILNGKKINKNEYDTQKKIIDILHEDNIFTLTHTFKISILKRTIINLWKNNNKKDV